MRSYVPVCRHAASALSVAQVSRDNVAAKSVCLPAVVVGRNVKRALSSRFKGEFVFVSEGVISVLLPNKCIERTAGKRCLPVHSGLRPTSAAHAQRYAAPEPI